MIKILDKHNFSEFKSYCMTYRNEHDESFLYEEDLDGFEIGYDNPTYLLYGDDGLEGVFSVMQDEYYLRGKKARVRIFHCKRNRLEDYKQLLEKLLPLDPKVEKLNMFIPNDNITAKVIIEAMGFIVERFSFVMERNGKAPNSYCFPEDYELSEFSLNRDEEDYLYVRNTAFANVVGSETPHTKEQVMDYMKAGQILKGGAKILRYKGQPVGIIRMEHENEEGEDYSFVAPLAILPEQHGKGLGSNLLRAGIKIGYDNGYPNCMLCVNVENENALGLYIKEGFEKKLEVACYALKLK